VPPSLVRSFAVHVLLLASAALPCSSPGQVPLGHAFIAGTSTTAVQDLWLLEPLNQRLVRVDPSALPLAFVASAVHVLAGGQRILLAGGPTTSADDVVLATALNGTTLTPPQPFANGLTGHAVGLFAAPARAEVVVVTEAGVFAVPSTGGAAARLTPAALRMGNLDSAFLPPSTVLTAAVDNTGQAFLWRLDLTSLQLASLPLRLSGRVSLAAGPQAGTVLVAEAAGQIWLVDLSSLARTPWVDVGRGPVRDLWEYGDQHAWFAAVGIEVVRISRQVLGPAVPLPPGGAQDLDYRPYESNVVAYGVACRGSASRLASVGWQGLPVPGNDTFTLTVGNARASTPVAMLVGVTAINLPLDAFGMPTCVLLTQPLVSIPASTTATGFAQVPFAIPPDPGLAGGRLFVQWLVIDPGANLAALVTSNGADVRV